MNLRSQKRIAASMLKCSPKRVKFDPERLDEIKEAITKTDLRLLVSDNGIVKNPTRGVSRGRARFNRSQKKKGRQRGYGSRKGRNTARQPAKETWMNLIRLQRDFLKELKDKNMLSNKDYRMLYRKAKGGFFRSRAHLKLYINENQLIIKQK